MEAPLGGLQVAIGTNFASLIEKNMCLNVLKGQELLVQHIPSDA
jgi:hypothetical protein